MKKLLGLMVAIVLMLSSFATFFGQVAMANAQTLDEADEYFIEFVLSDSTYEGELSFSHSPLYDQELSEHGREYTFSVGNVNGYALMIEIQGEGKTFYEIDELFYNKTSPFSNCQGLPVYVTHNTYLEYKEQAFFDINSGLEVDDELVFELAQKGFNYFGGTTATFTNTDIVIEYATKTTEEYSIEYDLPNIDGGAIGTSCANVAGAVIITYYDRFCENLLPNFVPYFIFFGAIFYRDTSAEVIQLTTTLNELMLIGEPHVGTTFSEFQLGMETYAENQGYTYTSTNVFSNGSFNFNSYKNSVENNKPVAIFLTNFTMHNGILEEEGKDTIGRGYCPVSHVEVGCGYKIDTYYDSNGNVISTRTYLKVASGLNSYGIGYLSLNGESAISKAISTQIS